MLTLHSYAHTYEQPHWNPHASLEWRTEWHKAGWRDVLRQKANGETVHPYMIELATECLALSDAELRQRLWP